MLEIRRIGARSSEKELERQRVATKQFSERFDQHFAAFFFVEPSEEKEKAFIAESGNFFKKLLLLALRISRRGGDAKRHNPLANTVRPEGVRRKPSLFFAGKQDRARVSQHAAFGP